MNTSLVGERIKDLRNERNLSQAQFGKMLNVSQDTVSLWELGKSLPSVADILNIIETFGSDKDPVTADYLLGLSDI